jgi:hypothetical protein
MFGNNNVGGFRVSKVIDGQKFYTTSEACLLAGTSRMTFLRWVRENKFSDVDHRDLNGWRLFSDQDIRNLKKRINRLHVADKTRN